MDRLEEVYHLLQSDVESNIYFYNTNKLVYNTYIFPENLYKFLSYVNTAKTKDNLIKIIYNLLKIVHNTSNSSSVCNVSYIVLYSNNYKHEAQQLMDDKNFTVSPRLFYGALYLCKPFNSTMMHELYTKIDNPTSIFEFIQAFEYSVVNIYEFCEQHALKDIPKVLEFLYSLDKEKFRFYSYIHYMCNNHSKKAMEPKRYHTILLKLFQFGYVCEFKIQKDITVNLLNSGINVNQLIIRSKIKQSRNLKSKHIQKVLQFIVVSDIVKYVMIPYIQYEQYVNVGYPMQKRRKVGDVPNHQQCPLM